MDIIQIIHQLQKNRAVFRALLEHESEEVYVWKPGPDKWCLLEILCHLYDEEREDFRTRVLFTLEKPGRPLPPFNPLLWVTEREYMKQEYNEKLQAFLTERDESIQWLTSLKDPEWENTYEHPKLGPMSAALFLNCWLAHDYLHIRQINKNKYLYLRDHVHTKLDYAGTW
jgi:hypothetical protein